MNFPDKVLETRENERRPTHMHVQVRRQVVVAATMKVLCSGEPRKARGIHVAPTFRPPRIFLNSLFDMKGTSWDESTAILSLITLWQVRDVH